MFANGSTLSADILKVEMTFIDFVFSYLRYLGLCNNTASVTLEFEYIGLNTLQI